MPSIRDQYAKLVIQKHHEKLRRPDGPWSDGLPQPRTPAPRDPKGTPITVGIIGARAAGLYASLIIDSLADPRITYETFDANPMEHRKGGGRLFTYDFPGGGANDYFVSSFRRNSSRLSIQLTYSVENSGCRCDAISQNPIHATCLRLDREE